jgi:hypothetical protein
LADQPLQVQAVQNDQSTGQVTNQDPQQQSYTPQPMTATADEIASSGLIAQLQFPSDKPKYYMRLDIFDYSRKSLFGGQQINTPTKDQIMSITLPLPTQLHDMHMAGWNTVPLKAMGALAGETAAGIKNRNTTQALTGAGGATALTALAGTQKGAQVLDLGGAITGVETALGGAISNFVVVTYQGPQYKRNNFTWKLVPRNDGESNDIRNIIKELNNAMAPTLIAGGAIFGFPMICWPSFMPNSRYLFKFKPSVITALTAVYSPGGQPSMMRKSTVDGFNAPEGIDLSMTILELEYWIKGNFTHTNDEHDVYDQTDPSNPIGTIQDILDKAKSTVTNTITGAATTLPPLDIPTP